MKQKPLVLWGGTDIDSNYYHQPRSKYADYPDFDRDRNEFRQAREATEKGIPIVGVCRGAQLLCIMNGGSLYQHSETERQNHHIHTRTGIFFNVKADHHQIMRPENSSSPIEILGWNLERVKVYPNDYWGFDDIATPEVIWYPEKKHLAIQPHPEWASEDDPFKIWINQLLEEFEIDFTF